MFSAAPMAYQNKKAYDLPAEEYDRLLADEKTVIHTSDRYAASYFTGTVERNKEVTVWYLDQTSMETRLQLASLFGLSQTCITH